MKEELFHQAMHLACGVAATYQDTDAEKATPCSEWTAKDLLNHMANELAWVPDMLAGKTIAEVGNKYEGDLLGDAAVANFKQYAGKAADAVMECTLGFTVHLSYGDFTAQKYVREVAADLLIHGWDLARALGAEYKVHDELATDALQAYNQIAEGGRTAGLLAAALPAPQGATEFEKILADSGRDVKWTAA